MSMIESSHVKCLRKTPWMGARRNFAVPRVLIFAGSVLAIGLAAWADALPFYKAGCEPTVPTASSSVTSSAPVLLDSRSVQSAISASTSFDSDAVPGMILVLR